MDQIEALIERVQLSRLSQAEIARRAQVNEKTVGRILARRHSPTLATLAKIYAVLDSEVSA